MIVDLPEKFKPLFGDSRYCIFYGGRGSGKSWAVAIGLVLQAASRPMRIVCAREFQNSIDESVHHLLAGRIRAMKLEGPNAYTIEKYKISHACGSEFIFKGLSKQDAAAVKSLEGADICWVEEAQGVSEGSWKNLTPTIRKEGSRIIITFNPDTEDSPTYQRFVLNPPSNADVVKVNWNDNPWFPAVLEQERVDMLASDPIAYKNVWDGEPRSFTEGAYFKDELEALERQGRIGNVPYDPSKPVQTFWDLGGSSGKSDATAIWFVQEDGTGFNLIDYWEANNVAYPIIVRDVIKGREYNYAKHTIPHDGGNEEPQTGKSDRQMLEDLGLNPVEVLKRTNDVIKDVNNTRLILPRCRFDKDKCRLGLASLKAYRQERNPKTGEWKFRHGWESHGTDAFRYFATGFEPTGKPQRFVRTFNPLV